MAGEPVFVDTNILVYASRPLSPFKLRAEAALLNASGTGSVLWFSRQILREYLVVVSRPQPTQPALPIALALADAKALMSKFSVAEDGPRVTRKLIELLAACPSAGKQIHDANIAATMLAHGIRHLLTFNVGDFRRFGSLIELVAV